MTPEEAQEDRLAELLADYDELIATGRLPVDSDRLDALDGAERGRIEELQECLRLLEKTWPRSANADSKDTPWWGPLKRSAFRMGAAPRRIGRFYIRSELGRGGFGVVYRALDPNLNRDVALKVPRPDVWMSAPLLARFLREGRAAGRLSHPNIVAVHESGEVDGTCYIASEYCPGPTLGAWLKRQTDPVPPKTAAKIMERLAWALEHAHARGIYHRDLKPSNIVLEPMEDSPLGDGLPFRPKLTDFGLAKIHESSGRDSTSGIVLGSARYMAPEQASSNGDVGPATDVYSLGVILYELLAGSVPILGETDIDTLRRAVAQEPVDLRRLRPSVPRDLETICMKCLEKDPSRRYPRAGSLARDLTRFLNGEVIHARPTPAWERGYRFLRRQPALAAALSTVVLLVASAFLAVSAYNARLNQALAETQRQRNVAEEQTRSNAHYLYAADLSLAEQALEGGNVPLVLDLLERHRPRQDDVDRRGFAWHLLERRAQAAQAVFLGHEGDVYHCGFSPGGRFVASAGKDRTARIWEVSTGREIRRFVGHSDEVNWVSYSPDGKLLATASDDWTARIWNASTAEVVHVLAGHEGKVVTAVFSPDGTRLATGSRDKSVRYWDVASGSPIVSFQAHDDVVRTMAYSHDGRRLLTGGGDGAAKLWDDAGRLIHDRIRVAGSVEGVAFSHDDRSVATAGSDYTVRLWDAESGRELALFPKDTRIVRSVALLGDRPIVLSAGDSGLVQVWDGASRQMIRTLPGHLDRVWSIALSPDNSKIATSSRDGSVRIWDPLRRDLHRRFNASGASVVDVAFSPDGARVACVDEWGGLHYWDRATGRSLGRSRIPGALRGSRIAYSPDGETLAATTYEGVVLWDAKKGEVRRKWGDLAGKVVDFAFMADGRRFAVGIDAPARSIEIRDIASGATVLRWTRPNVPAPIAVSPNGRHLAAPEGLEIRIWDAADGRMARTLRGAAKPIRGLEFSPDSLTLATADESGTVRFWDVGTGLSRRTIFAQGAGAPAIAFSPDGNSFATGNTDGEIRLWSVQTGQPLVTVQSFGHPVLRLAFSSESRALAAAAQNMKFATVWETYPD